MDAGYITPAIAKLLNSNNQMMYIPYKRPMTKRGKFKKYDYVYDEYYDWYLCPNGKEWKYSTTNREGYREYKSDTKDCKECPKRSECTDSKNHQKIVTRHVWEGELEEYRDHVRHSDQHKELYPKRKETRERCFADGKRRHGLDYSVYTGKEAVEFHTLLIYTGMNMKKYSKHMRRQKDKYAQKQTYEHQSEEVKRLIGVM